MIFAPVIIPTFCRVDHFKRCVESLARCTGAENTELFVGVDYPTKDEYVSGFKSICSYSKSISGFKDVHVYVRDHNYGVSGNLRALKESVQEAGFDRYIMSEDDNEFSPNFLQYVNQGLERYQDDQKVMAICGYPHSDEDLALMKDYRKNVYAMRGFCAWGTGFWFDHEEEFKKFYSSKELIFSWKLTFDLFRKGMYQTVHRLMLRYENAGGDLRRRAYCALDDKYCIFPMVPKVRNWGFDGSGINCSVINSYEKRYLDENGTFEMDQIDITQNKEVDKVYRSCYGMDLGERVLCVMEYFMFRMTGKRLRDIKPVRALIKRRVRNMNK